MVGISEFHYLATSLSRRTYQLTGRTTFLLQEKQRSHPLLKTEDVGGVEGFVFGEYNTVHLSQAC